MWLRLTPLAGAALWCALAPRWLEPAPLCGFRWLTGLPCPFCGMTHALPALARGLWSEALGWNALSPLAAGLLAAAPLLSLAPAAERWAWRGAAAAFAVYGVLRWF
ncbi:MAG: DUF2752 domain-containing protein [Acidobacteria bacterium]|nr:DUF2752 domain-containing protein [Acidobacteriota bacterium]